MVLVLTSITTVLYMYQYYVYQFLSLYSSVLYIRMRVGYMSITILVQCRTLERVQNASESDSNEQ